MNTQFNNLEQPKLVLHQGEGISQNEIVGANKTGEGSKLGKFKNEEALLEAYNNLQSDYTKKCQALAQRQKEEKENDNTSPVSSNFNWAEHAKTFFENNPKAKKYEDKLVHIVLEDKLIQNNVNPLETAWNRFKETKFLDEEELASNESFLQKYIFNNNDIKNKIVTDYFNALNGVNSPTLIATQKGSESVLTPVVKPKTISEARKIVEDMFK